MKKNGFTLVELAIVLVIVAILIAGILQGRDVLENMKINAIVTDIKEYTNAYEQFKEKYLFAPGDYPYAADAWPTTTSGDGDGSVEGVEFTYVWNQLSLGGMIKDFYSPSTFGDFDITDIGTVVPEAPYPNGAFNIRNYVLDDSQDNYGNANAIIIGKMIDKDDITGGLLTPAQANFIDSKLDDENPVGGNVWTWVGTNPFSAVFSECVDGSDDGDYTNDAYNLDNPNASCHVVYNLEPTFVD